MMRNPIACICVMCPAASGRLAVRITRASISRSIMSLNVQPAPRMTNAPRPNSAICEMGGKIVPWSLASKRPQRHGKNKSQVPIGRSSRAKRAYGRADAGKSRSTQWSVIASAGRCVSLLVMLHLYPIDGLYQERDIVS